VEHIRSLEIALRSHEWRHIRGSGCTQGGWMGALAPLAGDPHAGGGESRVRGLVARDALTVTAPSCLSALCTPKQMPMPVATGQG
jgi:hypothetical protein